MTCILRYTVFSISEIIFVSLSSFFLFVRLATQRLREDSSGRVVPLHTWLLTFKRPWLWSITDTVLLRDAAWLAVSGRCRYLLVHHRDRRRALLVHYAHQSPSLTLHFSPLTAGREECSTAESPGRTLCCFLLSWTPIDNYTLHLRDDKSFKWVWLIRLHRTLTFPVDFSMSINYKKPQE